MSQHLTKLVVGSPHKSDSPAADTAAVVTFAAEAGRKWVLTAATVSYNADPTGGKITIKDGTTVIYEIDITVKGIYELKLPPDGLEGTKGNLMSVTAAAGGATVTGKVSATAHPAKPD